MRYIAIIVCILLGSCSPRLPSSSNDEAGNVILLEIECTNNKQIEESVMQTLKLARISDVARKDYGTTLIIKARYWESSYQKALNIPNDLRIIPGVLDIQIETYVMPSKNSN